MRRAFLIPAVLLLALAASGCTHCGWIWEQGPRACHTDDTR
jgi:hypothetical protein